MAKAELKTKENEASVEDFLNKIADENIRQDCQRIAALMEKATDAAPKMWGANIIGIGLQHLKYESGRELDWLEIGFSPRKANLTLYGLTLDSGLMTHLGKHTTGKGCLYLKKISDIDEKVLEKLVEKSVENIRKGKK